QQAERAEAERNRLDGLRQDVQGFLDRGGAAAERRDWIQAHAAFAEARRRAGTEAGLATLAADANEQERRAGDGARALDQQARFRQLYARTLSHLTPQFSGRDRAADLADLRAAATQALAVLGVQPSGTEGPVFDRRFVSPAEQAQLRGGCYELLLILAAVEAA